LQWKAGIGAAPDATTTLLIHSHDHARLVELGDFAIDELHADGSLSRAGRPFGNNNIAPQDSAERRVHRALQCQSVLSFVRHQLCFFKTNK
jgi:hypothetical protein